jgi:glucose/mannose-6-phosphate isomerase
MSKSNYPIDMCRVDQNQIHRVYERWPEYFDDALRIPFSKIDHVPDFYNNLILCGMGGSATSCDIISDLLYSHSKTKSSVVRGTDLPKIVDRRSLVIVSSVSGDTEEAISNAKSAMDKGSEVICVSSGGQLMEFASSRGIQHVKIPTLSLPRASLPYLLMPCLKLLKGFFEPSIEHEMLNISRTLSEIRKSISITVPDEHNPAKRLAIFMRDAFVFCFTSPNLLSAGRRLKNSLNENAKVHCTNESILEASHNEIVPFTYNMKGFSRKVLFLTWNFDNSLVKNRFNKVSRFYSEIGQSFEWLNISQESMVTALLASIYILDFSTVYMAITKNLDPCPTPAIDILKRL